MGGWGDGLLGMKLKFLESKVRTSFLAAALMALSASAQAPLDIRVALVIGNSAYPASPLANPVNDARAMSETLRVLGFSVIEIRDGLREQMLEAIDKVRRSLDGKKAVGMLYYAGHGLQADYHNFMVPVDARLSNAADVPRQTVDVNSVIDAFKAAGNRFNIVVLDACRDNPFGDKSTGKGLAPMDAPAGTLLAYATAPGNVAEDGDSITGNGLYTSYLLKELQKPAARIEDVFKRVRLQVRQSSKGRQVPWESTSLEEDFYFNDGVKYTFRSEDLQRLALRSKEKEELLKREAEQAQQAERQQAAAKALEQFKASEAQRLADLELAAAQSREHEKLKRMDVQKAAELAFASEKADWDRIRDSKNPADLFAFLKKYPSGFISEQAQFRLDQLQQLELKVQPGKDALTALPSGVNRWQAGDSIVFENIDGFTKQSRRLTSYVTRADDRKVEFDGGQVVVDQMGGVLKNRFGVKDPAVLGVPADLAIGKKWRSAFRNVRPDGVIESSFWDSKVVGIEEMPFKSGKVKTFKVEKKGVATFPGGETQLSGTDWIDPASMMAIKSDRLFRSGGKIVEYFSMNVLDVRRAN